MSEATVAVVAGAGGALGHATTAALAARGFTVVALDRNEHAMSDLGDAVRKETADPGDPGAVTQLIDRIAAEAGPPGVLVNTVGSFRLGDALATTPEALRLMLDVNLRPALWLSQAVAPHTTAGFGCHRPYDRPARPGACEWHGGLQRQQGGPGAPDPHSRPRAPALRDPGERRRTAADRHPGQPGPLPADVMAHAVSPEAIAGVIAFLVSEAAAPVSGAILPAYGA